MMMNLQPTHDFADHLSQRLGVSRDCAEHILAEWISGYEPEARRPIVTLSPPDHQAVAPSNPNVLARRLLGGGQETH
jgi:hypothetical protein